MGSYGLWKRADEADVKLEADLCKASFYELSAFVRTRKLFSSSLDGRASNPASVATMVKTFYLVEMFDLWSGDQRKRYVEVHKFGSIHLTRSLPLRKVKQTVSNGATLVADLQFCWGRESGSQHPFHAETLHSSDGLFYAPALST